MALEKQLSQLPTTQAQYDAEEDFADCEIVCANGETVWSHRHLLRGIPWFKNAFKMHKVAPVKLDLARFPKHLVQKLVDFCAPTMVLAPTNTGCVPNKEDIPDYVAMVDFLMMNEQTLPAAVMDTFVTKVLNPIGAMVTADLLVAPTNDAPDSGTLRTDKLDDDVPPRATVLSPQSILYLFSHVTFDGWPESTDCIGPRGFVAIASAGVSMRRILNVYTFYADFFTDEVCAVYANRKREDLSDLVEVIDFNAPNASALVNRFLSMGMRPLILFNTDFHGRASQVSNFGWRLGWPLPRYATERRPAFLQLLKSIVDNTSLNPNEVKHIRELMCIIDKVDVPNGATVPQTYEIAALLGYYMASGHSTLLADPRLDTASPSTTIHNLVEKPGTSVRKTVLMRHLDKHKLLHDHTIATDFYDKAQ